jgi:hypothetical protein
VAEPPAAAAARAASYLIAGDGLREEGGGGGGGTVVVLHPQDLALAQHAAQRQLPGSYSLKKIRDCEGRKELAHTTVRLHLILFSKITGAFLFRIFGGFLHIPTTHIYCLTGAIISETHIIIITIHNPPRSSTGW